MRTALAIAALASVVPFLTPSTPAEAQTRRLYPWCFVQYEGVGRSGAYQCNFTSFAQCEATASGIGGMCHENPEVIAMRQSQGQQYPAGKPRRAPR